MIINHKVAMLVASQDGDPADTPDPSVMAVVEIDGVLVLFENPDERCLCVATLGGEKETGAKLIEKWYSFCEELADQDKNFPEKTDEARDAFVAWLTKNPV
jgi:hypothetical protein